MEDHEYRVEIRAEEVIAPLCRKTAKYVIYPRCKLKIRQLYGDYVLCGRTVASDSRTADRIKTVD